VPSWWQAPLSDEAPEAFVIETVNLGSEREFLFLSGFLIFVWSALAGSRRDKQCLPYLGQPRRCVCVLRKPGARASGAQR